MEIFKQDQYATIPVAKQVAVFYALINGFMDDVEVEKVKEFELGLYDYAEINGKDILNNIAKTGELNDKIENGLKKLIEDYKSTM